MGPGDDRVRWGTTASVAAGRSRTSPPVSWYSSTGPCGLAQVGGTGRSVGIACHRQRASPQGRASQQPPGQRLIALGPAPARARDRVEEGQMQRPGGGAFGQHRQVTGGDPAVPALQQRVVGQRLAG